MAKVRIAMSRAGIRAVARSGEVRAELERRAHKVAAAAEASSARPEGAAGVVDVSSMLGANRARASVMAPAGLASDRETGWLSGAADAARE